MSDGVHCRTGSLEIPRGAALKEKWDLIPPDTDVLLTHSPAFEVLDCVDYEGSVGCEELAIAIKRVKPSYHIFGHIHEDYGTRVVGPTTHVNASTCNGRYKPVNKPMVIEVSHVS